MPNAITKAARNYIATEQADVSALIRGLNRKHIELNKVQKEAERQVREAQEKYDKLKEKELELRRKESDLKKGKQQELNDFLIHSRRQLENLVRTLKEGEITRDKTLAVKQYISELTSETARLDAKSEAEEEKLLRDEEAFKKEQAGRKHPASNKKTKKKMSNAEALKYASSISTSLENDTKASVALYQKLEFVPGAAVIAGYNRNEGILIEETRKGVWNVQFGSVKMTMKQKDLTLVAKKQTEYTPSVTVDLATEDVGGQTIIEKGANRPVFELRLLGMYSDEAIRALEHQIDLCVLHNFQHFSVIHGKGDGVLQQAVRDYLSHCPAVEAFEFAPAEDGGAGKTYVTIK